MYALFMFPFLSIRIAILLVSGRGAVFTKMFPVFRESFLYK